jgi:hypothetical protein
LPTAIAEQHVDQRRAEGDLADAQGGAEIHRSQSQGGEDAEEESGGEDEQLTAHCR